MEKKREYLGGEFVFMGRGNSGNYKATILFPLIHLSCRCLHVILVVEDVLVFGFQLFVVSCQRPWPQNSFNVVLCEIFSSLPQL